MTPLPIFLSDLRVRVQGWVSERSQIFHTTQKHKIVQIQDWSRKPKAWSVHPDRCLSPMIFNYSDCRLPFPNSFSSLRVRALSELLFRPIAEPLDFDFVIPYNSVRWWPLWKSKKATYPMSWWARVQGIVFEFEYPASLFHWNFLSGWHDPHVDFQDPHTLGVGPAIIRCALQLLNDRLTHRDSFSVTVHQ